MPVDMLANVAERTVHGLLKQRAAERPNDPFLHFEGQDFTFGALHTAAARVAGGLAALGIGRGDKVAIMMGNRPEFLICWFALSQLGAIEVPINTAHRGTLLHYMLDQADCSLLILEGTFQDRLQDIAADLPKLRTVALLDGAGLDDISQQVVDFSVLESGTPPTDAPLIGPADPVAVMFTSGTTGPSKGAVLPQNYVLMQAAIIAEGCRYTPEDCLYNALPLFHGNAQFLSTIPALLSGARMVLARRFSASAFWDEVRTYKCTAFNYIGGILPILWKAPPSPEDANNSLRLMMGAGAPKDLFEAFETRFGVRLVEGYGMSEIGIPLNNSIDHRRPGCCGQPLPQYEVRLVDDDGADVPDDTPGELLIPRRLRASRRARIRGRRGRVRTRRRRSDDLPHAAPWPDPRTDRADAALSPSDGALHGAALRPHPRCTSQDADRTRAEIRPPRRGRHPGHLRPRVRPRMARAAEG